MSMMPEQAMAQQVAQAVADPGVSWEVFKYIMGLVLVYITGAYGLFWKGLAIIREDRKDASEGRKEIWDAITLLKDNDIEHLKTEISNLKQRMK